MNSHPQKGKFTGGPGEFFFPLLQQIAPLTCCSQLHGTGEKNPQSSAAIRYFLDTYPGASHYYQGHLF